MSKNNYDVLSKVVDVVIDIGRNLERIRAYAKLYPTPRMLEFTADLYAAMVEFLEEVIKDAKKNPISRCLWQPSVLVIANAKRPKKNRTRDDGLSATFRRQIRGPLSQDEEHADAHRRRCESVPPRETGHDEPLDSQIP